MNQSVRATLRRLAKRRLNKFGCPPNLRARAVAAVREQARQLISAGACGYR
ncbi:MAG: hypothetical protein ACRYG7_46165 [Janthinobacterium lividum]